MTAYGKGIEEERKKKDLSKRELARLADCSEGYVRSIERGDRFQSFQLIREVAKALGIEDEIFTLWLAEEYGDLNLTLNLRQAPVISWGAAGNFQEALEQQWDEYVSTTQKGNFVFVLKVDGDSMEPEFTQGEYIVVNPHIAYEINDFVIVKNKSHETMLKQLKKNGSYWTLHPLNPKYKDIIVDNMNLEVIGVVAEKAKRYK
jgi:SOS-response transcriptional repressor LexA